MSRGSTIFPQAIGLACTWDPHLATALAAAVREQMRATSVHQALSPCSTSAATPAGAAPRAFGEDPHVVARIGVAFVRGLQGDDLATGVVATAKHFVGYAALRGRPQSGRPPTSGARELREVHLRPFEAVVRDAGVRAVMNAYNELDGMPVAAQTAPC